MTEAEWLAANHPDRMLRFLDADAEGIQPYFFMAACLRRVEHLMPGPESRSIASHLERLAGREVDGDARAMVWDMLENAREAAQTEAQAVRTTDGKNRLSVYAALAASEWSPAYVAELTADATAEVHADMSEVVRAEEELIQSLLVRDIFGNPFRPVSFAPEWRTSTALALATQMCESRDFGAMPILADALQDAGCADENILLHCRGPGPHVRGCWVVDLVLGKE